MPGSNSETLGRFCNGLGSRIMAQYSVGPIITRHHRITAREYVNSLGSKVHAVIQMLFSNNDTVFQVDSGPIHIAGTVCSWFEEHEIELQYHLWPAQSFEHF
jgi:hypothetical protein